LHANGEKVTLQTSVAFYNLFNFANFDLPAALLSGLLTGDAGQINAANALAHNIDRVGVRTGVYSLGAPRQIEFGLRLLSKANNCFQHAYTKWRSVQFGNIVPGAYSPRIPKFSKTRTLGRP